MQIMDKDYLHECEVEFMYNKRSVIQYGNSYGRHLKMMMLSHVVIRQYAIVIIAAASAAATRNTHSKSNACIYFKIRGTRLIRNCEYHSISVNGK